MKLDSKIQENIKKAIGKQAATLVQEGMLVGLGTGSTAVCFIEELIKRVKEGLSIHAVSSSVRSLELARKGGIPLTDMDTVTEIDLYIDGADEVDPWNRLIKGKGGALVREKILAATSRTMVVIADEGKLVERLGACGLPIEIIPFGYQATIAKLQRFGYVGTLRQERNIPYHTDNGNYIYDIHTPSFFSQPETDEAKIISVPGVVDTGFFFKLASKVLIGYADGRVAFRE